MTTGCGMISIKLQIATTTRFECIIIMHERVRCRISCPSQKTSVSTDFNRAPLAKKTVLSVVRCIPFKSFVNFDDDGRSIQTDLVNFNGVDAIVSWRWVCQYANKNCFNQIRGHDKIAKCSIDRNWIQSNERQRMQMANEMASFVRASASMRGIRANPSISEN